MKATLYEQPRQAIADCHIDMVYDYILLVTKAFGEIVTGKEVKRLHFNAPIVACVCAQFNGRLEVLMDEIVTGARVRANIFFDTFMKLGNKHLGITEAKRGDIRQGLERAYIGCEVIADAEGLSKVYSIVTDYRVKKKKTPEDEEREKKLPLDFTNYNAVLALPEVYFVDDEDLFDDEPASAAPSVRPLSAAEQKRLVDEAFAQDLNAEVASLLMELEELSVGVYSAFHDVKLEKATLIEATAVAKVAINSAASVIAKVQLCYPTIRDANALMGLIRDRLTLVELDRLEARVTAAWHHDDSEDEDNTKYRYVPGTVLMDVLWLAPILIAFGNQIRARPGMRFQANTDLHGERYSEDDSPLYSMPVVRAGATFISQQLPPVYVRGFSTSGHVSIQLLFVCICWLRSVAALEGSRGLGRAISLSITHQWDLADRLRSSIEHAGARYIDPPSLENWRNLLADIKNFDGCTGQLRLNPLLAGCFLKYHQAKYLSIGHNTVITNSRFEAFCHLYSDLRDRQLLEEIPFIEDTIRVYESAIFPAPRSQVTQGSFEQSFLTSKKQVEASINASSIRRSSRIPDPTTPAWLRMQFEHFSHAGNILFANEYSALPTSSTAYASWTSLLKAVSNQFSKEIFDSRVLSRDLLKLNDELTDLFFTLRDELCRGDAYEDMLEGPFHNEIQAVTSAVEACVMFPLLSLLDSLALDGRVRVMPDIISDLEDFQRRRMRGRSSVSEVVVGYCKHAADVIARKFGGGSDKIEKLYFTLPPTPAWASLEFGDAHSQLTSSHLSKRMANPKTFLQTHRSQAQVMDYLLDLMKNSRGPLHGEGLRDFKQNVIANPGISIWHHAIRLSSCRHCCTAQQLDLLTTGGWWSG
ncbi:hypothetical protein Poli38472_000704 [Pythium oligandrum]|uniref:Uncharacterized protein n=1 Tax=Pythium oligandrum TaxID=41045 RepID=A0A8K1FID3_PYTOL|nr:hypothetical protein Poli38472_000704 [Pythium oligandrum]|eukprot:TMW60662.1 hypothetical protein Poli38472_000704 [Pythium oligandrum]